MTIDELFSNKPKSEIKRKPKPSRRKKKSPTFDERREAGLNPQHNWKTYDELSDEEHAVIRKHIISSIKKKMEKSPRFKKYKIRLINSSLAVRYGRPTKTCTKCGKLRGLTMFDKIKDPKKGKNVRRPYCTLCRKKMNAEYYQRKKNANNS